MTAGVMVLRAQIRVLGVPFVERASTQQTKHSYFNFAYQRLAEAYVAMIVYEGCLRLGGTSTLVDSFFSSSFILTSFRLHTRR